MLAYNYNYRKVIEKCNNSFNLLTRLYSVPFQKYFWEETMNVYDVYKSCYSVGNRCYILNLKQQH